MLKSLELENAGPASSMTLELAPRLNLLTGDNGLGKSFLLDVAWWALTRRWPQEVNRRMTSGFPARPLDRTESAFIRFKGQGKTRPVQSEWEYSRKDEAWLSTRGRPWLPGLVVYAHADGSFSVWDPARNYWKQQGNTDIQGEWPAYVFTETEVWDGLWGHVDSRMIPVCNGLLSDWSAWVGAKNDDNARIMASVLRALSSPGQNPDGAIEPGPLMRLSVKDSRSIPSINTSYAGPVPILHASSGIRRVCTLAYMLVWTWSEHRIAAELRGEETSPRIIMLFDEVESHLYPRWQRSILTSLLNIGNELQDDIELQLVVTTHSPLVLASAEAWFDPEQDAWFDLDLEGDPPQAHLQRRAYTPRGHCRGLADERGFRLVDGPGQRGSGARDPPCARASPAIRATTRRGNAGPRSVTRSAAGRRSVLGTMERIRGAPRGDSMIPVTPAPEPAAFDGKVRQSGLRAIAELAGEQPTPPRTAGRPYPRVAASRDEIPADKFPPYWREMLDDLMRSYHRICAYLCLYIPRGTGAPSVDHAVAKSRRWDQIYEWSNYRWRAR